METIGLIWFWMCGIGLVTLLLTGFFEVIARKCNDNNRFKIWWRQHIISDTYVE